MRRYGSVVQALALASALAVFVSSCSKASPDINSETGRLAIIDETNNDLTAGNCQAAHDALEPLYDSQYVDNDVRLLYASVYGCFGGINFASIIASLKTSTSDIWSSLVLSDYSTGSDGKAAALVTAASILLQTASTPGSFSASLRDDDANTYMIIVELEEVATIIGPDGQASQTTGHQETTGWPATASAAQQCEVEVAVATIEDSLENLSDTSAFKSVENALTVDCGGACPTNKDISACTGVEDLEGQAIMTLISSEWTGPP